MADERDEIRPLEPNDPYWMHTAILHVRNRHARAGTQPATFGDLIREADEFAAQEKARLGVKPTSRPEPR